MIFSRQTLAVDMMDDVERVSGAARRRRERRLRSWLKHERQTVRMVLAETFHHSSAPFPPKLKEEWVGRHETHDALRGQNTARTREATYYTSKTSVAGDTAFFSLFDEEDAVWGTRPTGLVEPQGPQERVQRHAVEQMIESFVPVPMLDLDAPVPPMVDQLVDVLKLFDNSVPEQVIDVPKISQDAIPQRTVLFEPQLAEQLVEVPTAVTFVPGRALFNDRHGHEWVVGSHWGVLLERLFQLHPVGAPGWIHRQPRAVYKYWATLTMHYKFQQSSPIYCGRYLRFVHRQSVGQCSSWLVVYMPVVVPTTGPGSDSGENCGSAVAFL